MDPQKPRRRAKLFSKLFHREATGHSRIASEPKEPRELVEASAHGSSRSGTTSTNTLQVTTSATSSSQTKRIESNVQETLPPLQILAANHSNNHNAKSEEAFTPGQHDKERGPGNLEILPEPQKASRVPVARVLAAPTVKFENTVKSTSPYRKEEELEKLPSLLDPQIRMRNAKLWERSYDQLSSNKNYRDLFKNYEAILEESSPARGSSASFPQKMQAAVQCQVDIMKQKQWVLQWDQKSIVVRDQAERIVKFVQTFSNLGAAIAQIDPIHVGIPWAGLILNDSTQHQEALSGLEEISSVVAKYIPVENVYVQNCAVDPCAETNAAFEASILKVYSDVLLFQVHATLHFHRSTMARTLSNIAKSVDWTKLLSNIKKSDVDCVAMTSMVGMANLGSDVSNINHSLLVLRQNYNELQEVNQILHNIQEKWEAKQTENTRIVSWVSDIQIGEDHERVRTKLGARHWDAGQWFLQNSGFKDWRNSPRGLFWLQGSVGTGKTSLASIVINDLVKTDNRSIAFYYCSRGSAAAANNPVAIFRSLVAQLSCHSDGEEVYQVIRDWYKRDAKRYVTGSRLSLMECEELLVTLMTLRGKTVIVVDGIDECSEPMQLLRALSQIWENFTQLKLFLASRLDVAVAEIFPRITTVRSDFSKTASDIRDYIRKELERTERRNAKVITDELAERMVNILTQRAQGMFRWVELQLNLLISAERRIKYRRDFEDRLIELESGSGKQVLDSLRETYDYIYERNTQGPHSRRLAEKSLKWVLCAARPLKIWELGAAVSVDGEDRVTTDLIVDICSNFFMVDQRGFVQLAHLSVREYLEVKQVGGRLIFSPEEAHAEAALTCLLYWKNFAKTISTGEPDDAFEVDDDSHNEHDEPYDDEELLVSDQIRGGKMFVDREFEDRVDEKKSEKSPENVGENYEYMVSWGSKDPNSSSRHANTYKSPPSSGNTVTWGQSETKYYDFSDVELTMANEERSAIRRERRPQERIMEEEVESYEREADTPDSMVISGTIDSQLPDETTDAPGAVSPNPDATPQDFSDDEVIRVITPPEFDTNITQKESPYSAPNGDYFHLVDTYLKTDSAPSLRPQKALKRFQRYASIYWATHCQASKSVRIDESRPLNTLFFDFLEADGSNPAFQLWATALLIEAKFASIPTIDPAPMIFLPATGHDRDILDAEPFYERWQQTIAYVDGPQPLMPTVPLIACFCGFTDIIEEISEEGSAQVSRNHEGTMGLVLAAGNGHDEVLDLPISSHFYLDVPDKKSRTALHIAAIGGYVELARLLLGYARKASGRKGNKNRKPRVDVNARDLEMRTPLHYAAQVGQMEMVKLLLCEEDIDFHARSDYGLTALGYCVQHAEVARLLRADRRYSSEDDEVLYYDFME
ncbi:hypothetical protein EG329_012109 [Mollisiaceae sp. DMI_Dod_QoI]|nr:hypothetical protein EG329_012109 [Helotiales sp. DMI_Dod_QoI]